MTAWQLSLKQAPTLRLDLRRISPAALAGLDAAAIGQLPLGLASGTVPLAEFFNVQAVAGEAGSLHLVGDLSRCDRIGWQMDQGRLQVDGSVGDHLGAGLRGGEIHVNGSARDLAACEMAGGRLVVQGNVGDFAASTLPGSMDGMRGGAFIVRGSAGQRFGDRMRRGTAIVEGDVGDFFASRLVAGTLVVGGRCGAHPGWGMRRGSLVFADPDASVHPLPAATFVPAGAEAPVFWQLLSRDLARHSSQLAGLPQRRITRWLGDLAADGKGEMIFVA